MFSTRCAWRRAKEISSKKKKIKPTVLWRESFRPQLCWSNFSRDPRIRLYCVECWATYKRNLKKTSLVLARSTATPKLQSVASGACAEAQHTLRVPFHHRLLRVQPLHLKVAWFSVRFYIARHCTSLFLHCVSRCTLMLAFRMFSVNLPLLSGLADQLGDFIVLRHEPETFVSSCPSLQIMFWALFFYSSFFC